MRVNVKGGTPNHGKDSLCKTCSHFKYRRGDSENSEQISCRKFDDQAAIGHVTECSEFNEKGRLPLWDLQQMAHILIVDPKKKFGFVRYNEWKKENEDEELLPGHGV